MQLRFYARGSDLVSLPGERRIVGQQPRYIGRSLKSVTVDGKAFPARPATEEPHCCEADGAQAPKLIQRAQEGSLWPADHATATACGVPFVEVSFFDGEWLPSERPKPISPVRAFKGSKD